MDSTTTVKITDYNDTTKTREADVKFNGSLVANEIYVEKFNICKVFPVYIPKLVTLDTNASIPAKTKMNINQAYSSLPYIMNLAVMVETSNNFAVTNVRYVSNRSVLVPFPFDISNKDLARLETLNNEYFYMYSTLELTKMITDAIEQCLTACGVTFNTGDVYIGMLESGYYQLMIKESLNVNIYFNYNLRILFPFQTINTLNDDDLHQLVFNPSLTTSYNNTNFSITQTIYLSSRIFPFRNLIMTSTTLNCQPILTSNNLSSNIYNNKVVELLSYSLNIDQPDHANDLIEFQMSNLYKVLQLNGDLISNFKIDVYLQTIDGYNVYLRLKNQEFCQIQLCFR